MGSSGAGAAVTAGEAGGGVAGFLPAGAGLAFGLAAGLLESGGAWAAGGVCAAAPAVNARTNASARIGRSMFIPASSPLCSGICENRRMRLPDRLLGLFQRGRSAMRIGPDEIADQHEIRACAGEFAALCVSFRKTDAGRLEQFVPPLQPLGDRIDRRPLPAFI